MTTLLQMMAETTWEPRDRLGGWLRTYWRGTLTGQPTPHGDPPEWRAEPFVFNADAPSTVAELVRAKAMPGDIVHRTARLPNPTTWVEWLAPRKDRGGRLYRMGCLIDERLDDLHNSGHHSVMFFVESDVPGESRTRGVPYMWAAVPKLPCRDPAGLRVYARWILGIGEIEKAGQVTNEIADQIKVLGSDMLACLFLLTTPRICEIKEVQHDAKLQKARRHKGKLPLLEYRQLTLKVGHGTTRYRNATASEREAEDEAARRRLHKVIGHFRIYDRNTETEHVTWVPPHWRGDPALGIVLHERDVVIPSDLRPMKV